MSLKTTAGGFPPFTLVTATSEAVFGGCEDPDFADLSGGRFTQYLPVGTGEIARVAVLLTGPGVPSADIPARIFRCDPLPVSPRPSANAGRPLAETVLPWKAGEPHWIEWATNLSPLAGLKVGHYIRIELDLPPGVGWVRNKTLEPIAPGFLMDANGAPDAGAAESSFCFRVSPAQPCFWASNVLPEAPNQNRFTGTWRSDPAAGLPQSIEASWQEAVAVNELRLDFPDSPERPSAYRIEMAGQNRAPHFLEVTANHSGQAIHPFDPPLPTDRIRIEFLAVQQGTTVSLHRIRLNHSGLLPEAGSGSCSIS